MKKILSILLATVMIFSLAITAFAADNIADEEGKASADKDVTASYDEGIKDQTVATVYFVKVDWETQSTLKYFDGTTTYKWNAAETKYEEVAPEDKGWSGEATVKVTVTNQSNAEITAAATWNAAVGLTVACTFDEATKTVASAAEGVEIKAEAEGEAQTGIINATISQPTAGTISEDNAVVGTIRVNIAPVAAAEEP